MEVTLTDGATESVDVLIGADGVHSWVRRLAFGSTAPFTRELGYHMAAFILNEPPRQLHARNAFVMQIPAHRERQFRTNVNADSDRC
jgi:2-polyprenyl-6-methoxyphenol hydroxylase-like FAD-dependent oxidoreductase